MDDSPRTHPFALSRSFASLVLQFKAVALVAALLLTPACTRPEQAIEPAADLILDPERIAAQLGAQASACKRDSSNCSDTAPHSGNHDASSSAQVSYFPDRLREPIVPCHLGNRVKHVPAVGKLKDDWYAQHLKAAGEPVLHTRTQGWRAGRSVIRFTWLRTFHPPVVVRIEQFDGQAPRLTAKQLSGAGGYDPGNISQTVERNLNLTEADSFRRLLTRTNVVGLPFECTIGIDGAQWLIEAVDANGYHFIARLSPEDGPVYEVGTHLLLLTGWKFGDVY